MPPKVGMKMNLVILSPLGKVIGNQLLSLSLIIFFFSFPSSSPLENITVYCICLWNEKCNYFAKDSGVGFAAVFPPIWEVFLELITIVLPVWLSQNSEC